MRTRHRGQGRAVLLLVDFINHFQFRNAAKLAPRAVRAARAAARLKFEMDRRGSTCVYVNDNFGAWNTEFSGLVAKCLEQGGASGEIAALLRPQPRDYSVLKPRHSGFYGTPLAFFLQEINPSTVIIAGIAVDMCVMATAQDAHIRKYKIRVPANCVAGFSRAQEVAALTMMKRTLDADTAAYHLRARR